MDERLQRLADLIAAQTRARLIADYGETFCSLDRDSTVEIKPGAKYIKVDVGRSGKYMIVAATGEIFGIKGYGVIHRGHQYGTLDTIDEWQWGGYTAVRR